MMQASQYLLRPVNPYFIAVSLLLALFFGLLPWSEPLWVPDVMVLVLMFWNIHQPRKVSIGTAFFFGAIMDIQNGAWLGEHALAYTLLSYFAITIHRRELWLTRMGRAVHVVLLLLLVRTVLLLVRMVMSGSYPDWTYFIPVPIEALLWPVFSWLLLLPQQRPEDVDTTRPI